MKLKLVAVFASVLLIATGAAMAMPGNAPDQIQSGNGQADERAQADDRAQNATDSGHADGEADGNASDARRGPPADVPGPGAADATNGSQGPPVDLPAQVPDFVSDAHEVIGSHVDGAQSLGEQISELTPDEDANETAPDGNATVTAVP